LINHVRISDEGSRESVMPGLGDRDVESETSIEIERFERRDVSGPHPRGG
jgi:hypothetical protein